MRSADKLWVVLVVVIVALIIAMACIMQAIARRGDVAAPHFGGRRRRKDANHKIELIHVTNRDETQLIQIMSDGAIRPGAEPE